MAGTGKTMSPILPATVNVALVGNPNTGKSTLFGALVGAQQRVGNYPGVTVETKAGRLATQARSYQIVDLPGLYSLAPRGLDEMVSVDVLLGRVASVGKIDLVVCIVDASNLRRNLYLIGQVLDLGLPTIVVLNKLDLAESHGIRVNVEQLRKRLPVEVVVTQANSGQGIDNLKNTMDAVDLGATRRREKIFPEGFEAELANLTPLVEGVCRCVANKIVPEWLTSRLLLDSSGFLEETLLGHGPGRCGGCGRHGQGRGCGRGHGRGRGRPEGKGRGQQAQKLRLELDAARRRLIEAGCAVPGVETESRYRWVDQVLDGVVETPMKRLRTRSDRIDEVLAHPIYGMIIFVLVMFVMFQAVFSWAEPFMGWTATGIGWMQQVVVGWLAGTNLAGGAVESLLVRGLFGGVGNVLEFLPQIIILFFFIAVLEQCGYMARAAFLMDRVMARVGLNGQAFIPLLCCFACAVPGIMATRVISDWRSRMTTILVAPLMACSARLFVYLLLITAFIPDRSYLGGLVNLRGLTLVALYLLGVIIAIVAALLLKRTAFRGPATSLLMEMPSYEWPRPRAVLFRVMERAWLFIRGAGTMILLVSILVWAALYYPRPAEIEQSFAPRRATIEKSLAKASNDRSEQKRLKAEQNRLEAEMEAAYQRQSLLARMGRTIEPVVRPLGWDWRIGSAVLASFPQREAVIATLGVIFSNGSSTGEEDEVLLGEQLQRATWEGTDRPLFTLPVALSILVFYALCAQCVATLAVIRQETGSWRWPIVTFLWMTGLAYAGALVTYQFGTWLGK